MIEVKNYDPTGIKLKDQPCFSEYYKVKFYGTEFPEFLTESAHGFVIRIRYGSRSDFIEEFFQLFFGNKFQILVKTKYNDQKDRPKKGKEEEKREPRDPSKLQIVYSKITPMC